MVLNPCGSRGSHVWSEKRGLSICISQSSPAHTHVFLSPCSLLLLGRWESLCKRQGSHMHSERAATRYLTPFIYWGRIQNRGRGCYCPVRARSSEPR